MGIFKGNTNRVIFAVAIVIILAINLGVSVYLGFGEAVSSVASLANGSAGPRAQMFLVSALVLGVIDFIALVFAIRRGNEAQSKFIAGLWLVGMIFDIFDWSFLFLLRPMTFFLLALIIGLALPAKVNPATNNVTI